MKSPDIVWSISSIAVISDISRPNSTSVGGPSGSGLWSIRNAGRSQTFSAKIGKGENDRIATTRSGR
jgi:hypothetical protein